MPSPAAFADRIVNVAVTGSLIRLELAVVAPPAAEGQKPELRPTQTVVMPIEGFAASFGMLEAVVRKLVADGVLKPRPQVEGASNSAMPPATQ